MNNLMAAFFLCNQLQEHKTRTVMIDTETMDINGDVHIRMLWNMVDIFSNRPVPNLESQSIQYFFKNVKENGVLVPIQIYRSGKIKDGLLRYHASKAAGLTTIPVEIIK